MQHVDPSAPSDESVVEGEWGDPRKWAVGYIAFTALVSLAYLWSISVPGMKVLSRLVGVLGLVAVVVIWCALAFAAVMRVVRRTSPRVSAVLVIVPVIVAGTVAARATEAPLRLRFGQARDEMTAYATDVVAAAPAAAPGTAAPGTAAAEAAQDPAWGHLDAPDSIGGIAISHATRVPGGVLLYDTVGDFLDDAGYAYLPDGEFPPSTGWFERPRFRSLGGGWYAFTASW